MTNKEPTKEVVTDEALLRLIRQKEESALAMLYQNRSGLVYSLAYSVVRNVPDAEEVTQEVFLKIWTKADSFDRARGSALAWITTMTRRAAIDRTRSKAYRARLRETSVDQLPAGSAGQAQRSVTNDGAAMVEGKEIANVLGRLDRKHREVIQLSYFEGLSHSKIADQLDTPLGTVKSRIREAVGQLRRILDAEA